jgi:hypothetical protein
VQRTLDVLTGHLWERFATDLSRGGIVDTHEQVSATTRYEVLDVGLQQVSDDQDTATVVVFGQYVVRSVDSGTQTHPRARSARSRRRVRSRAPRPCSCSSRAWTATGRSATSPC